MIFAWLGASTDPAVLEHLCTLLQSGLEYYSALQWHQLRTTPISESGSVINNRRHQFGRFSSREMSSNVHYTQIRDPQLLDIIDEAWLRDKLPDDNIPLPPGMQGFTEDTDELQQEPQPPLKQKERWLDLGLQHLH